MKNLEKYLAIPVIWLSIATNAIAEDRISRSTYDKPELHEIISNEKGYDQILQEINQKRTILSKEYQLADKETQKEILDESREVIYNTLVNEVFPAWYGTNWSYNGTSQVPQKKSIACGYFIGTTLEDVGFKLDRKKIGRELAGNIIDTFSEKKDITEFIYKPIEEVKEEIKKQGEGLYIIGYSNHVGFVVNDGENINLVHSSRHPPKKVASIPIEDFYPDDDADYRITGKILDDNMIKKWLLDEKFPIQKEFFQKYVKK